MRLVWCGLYDGAAYLSTSESYLRDLGVVRLIPRVAYSPEITVPVLHLLKVISEIKLITTKVSLFDNPSYKCTMYKRKPH